MFGYPLGLDVAVREQIVLAGLVATALLLLAASWPRTPDRLAKALVVATIATVTLVGNFVVTLAGGGSALDIHQFAAQTAAAATQQHRELPTVQTRAADAHRAGAAGQAGTGRGADGIVGTLASLVVVDRRSDVPETLRDCPECPLMRGIRPGFFEMGASRIGEGGSASGGRIVRIGYRYAISAGEISRSQWRAFAMATGRAMPTCRGRNAGAGSEKSDLSAGGDRIACITHEEAQAYASWLAQRTGQRYRLASEAEWEYAARAGSQRRYWSGLIAPQSIGDLMPANPFGLAGIHDRFGERVADCWSDHLPDDVAAGAAFHWSACRYGVVKDFRPDGGRASADAREPLERSTRHDRIGMRVVRSLD